MRDKKADCAPFEMFAPEPRQELPNRILRRIAPLFGLTACYTLPPYLNFSAHNNQPVNVKEAK